MTRKMFDASGETAGMIPDVLLTAELLADGSFLQNALGIYTQNPTEQNLLRLANILRHSLVWIPCNAVLSDADYREWTKRLSEAEQSGSLDELTGQEFTPQEQLRMVPDILQNGDRFFFPVFTSDAEMGEYGTAFSQIQASFLKAAELARNQEKPVSGIIINAFTDAFVVPVDFLALIAAAGGQ